MALSLGKHKGYPFYTIGQRKGLDIALGKPMFVTHINPDTNTVTLGDEVELDKPDMYVARINMVKYAGIDDGLKADTKIRYKTKPSASVLYNEGGKVKVIFDEPVKGIAPDERFFMKGMM